MWCSLSVITSVLSDIAVPAMPSLFTAQGNSTGVYLNWTAVDGATSYTVYWCEGSLHDLRCKVGFHGSLGHFQAGLV